MMTDKEFYSILKGNGTKLYTIRAEDLAALLLHNQFSNDFHIESSPAIGHNIDSCWKQFSGQLFKKNFIKVLKGGQ